MTTAIRPTRADVEALAHRQREARAADLPVPPLPAEWDLIDAVLTGADLSGAVLTGADLYGADLRGATLWVADLRGAKLGGADLIDAKLGAADLRGADLRGAVIAEGTVVAAVAGKDGGYDWHALLVADGVVIVHYGCNRSSLAEWRTRGPEYGERHGHGPEHWAVGPAVAIAAAERLAAGT